MAKVRVGPDARAALSMAVAAGGRRAASVVLWCRCARVSISPRPSDSLFCRASLRLWSDWSSPGSPAPRTGRRTRIWGAVPCRERRARRGCFQPGLGLGARLRVRGQGKSRARVRARVRARARARARARLGLGLGLGLACFPPSAGTAPCPPACRRGVHGGRVL